MSDLGGQRSSDGRLELFLRDQDFHQSSPGSVSTLRRTTARVSLPILAFSADASPATHRIAWSLTTSTTRSRHHLGTRASMRISCTFLEPAAPRGVNAIARKPAPNPQSGSNGIGV